MTKNFRKKNTDENFPYLYFDKKLQFTDPYASINDVQATGEAFSPQKRTWSTSKNEIYELFSMFLGHFLSSLIRIRIRNPAPDTDPETPLNPDPIRIHNTEFDVDLAKYR